MKVRKRCVHCKEGFYTDRNQQRYCSSQCRTERAKKKYRKYNNNKKRDHLNTGQIGTISELLVCANLIGQGFEVFRSVNPASPFDMVIFKDNKLYKVEVKSGFFTEANVLRYPSPTNKFFDIIAVVIGKKILYTSSELEEKGRFVKKIKNL